MRVKKNQILFMFGLLISMDSFGYISGKVNVPDSLFYCPSQVVCAEGGDLESCKFENDHLDYWRSVTKNPDYQIISGTYKLNRVLASYHSSARPAATCTYNDPVTQQEALFIGTHELANLEVHYSSNTAWILGSLPMCSSGKAELCPLQQSSGFLIKTKNVQELVAKVNNMQIASQTGYLPAIIYISYDDALSACVGKFCKIDIASKRGAIYGNVTVNMDNKVKIDHVEATRSSEVEVNTVKPFNAVEVKYHDSMAAKLAQSAL